MKHSIILSSILTLFTALCASSCASTAAPPPESVRGMVGAEFYTRHCILQEKDSWRSTNYGRGTLVPINTKVRVDGITSTTILLTIVDSSQPLKLSNIAKYTGGGIDVLAERTLSAEPTDFSGSEFESDIQAGQLRLGMSKDEAVLARGYPPVHRTASTDVDRWIYQQNRFAIQTVVFREGKLVEGRGIF